MTSSEQERDPGTTVREDVHIHASLPEIHRHLADPNELAGALSGHFRAVRTDEDHLAFTLALPLRREHGDLRRGGSEDRAITYERNGGGSIHSLTLAVHVESARECHLTAEIAYEPHRGPVGLLLETLFHRPHRSQALRDSLWGLKHRIEERRNGA